MTAAALVQESVWFDASKYREAEERFILSQQDNRCCTAAGKSALVDEIARARQQIKNSLTADSHVGGGGDSSELISRVGKLEHENASLKKMVDEMKTCIASLTSLTTRVENLEKNCKVSPPAQKQNATKPASKPKQEKKVDDDVDLFGSDDEVDPEQEKIKAERLKMYQEKKSKKPALVAKSNVVLDVKPWDDETDMKKMEEKVREITQDGLRWGASKLVPLAYGIHKLQISCVIEDEKVSVDLLQEQIEANEDFVQSVDIAAFNKL